ncbi:MAG: aminotransferase class V-fold PLP-dependent enzyme [Burkholderiales bacterium]|nr:aminotransferase class V-fold PLP-dependent enzyme [Burkholderiales bacterium]
MITLADCSALDARDPLAALRERFEPAPAGTIFLDANSMGALPKAAGERMRRALYDEWSAHRRHAWTVADWLDAPQRIGAAYARVLGAHADEVIAVDNTTLNLHKLAAYALALTAGDARRRRIVHEREGFPTDCHVVQGLVHHGGGRWDAQPFDDPAELPALLGPETALVVLSHADYRSAFRWDMAAVNARARAAGVRVVWDCSHSAGAVPLDLAGSGAEFAVVCGYKYLCGGPGAAALAYIRRDLQDRAWPALPGWLGHADRMNFRVDYAPAPGMLSLVSGTMPVLQNAVMETAAAIWAEVDPRDLAWKHRSLSETLCTLLAEQCGALGVTLASPADYDARGGHVAFRCPGGGPACEALLADGVVGSFRAPDVIRFGLSALTLSHEELWQAVARLRTILAEERWRDPRFANVSV